MPMNEYWNYVPQSIPTETKISSVYNSNESLFNINNP